MAAAAEDIVICIDNSRWVTPELLKVQCEATELYCKKKNEAHPETFAGLYTIGDHTHLFYPSRRSSQDIAKLCSCISPTHGELDLHKTLSFGLAPFLDLLEQEPQDRPKNLRMLIFVGGPIDLDLQAALFYGKTLKNEGIAVDVVNFHLKKIPKGFATSFRKYRSSELDIFFKTCNNKNNSHIAHIDLKSVNFTANLSKYILNWTGKENVNVNGEMEMPKNEAAADEEARGSEYGKHAPLSAGELKVKNRAAADDKALGYEDDNVTISKEEKKNNDVDTDEEANEYEDDSVTSDEDEIWQACPSFKGGRCPCR